MSARAEIRQADLNRVLKAAKVHGFTVRIERGIVTLLPNAAAPALPSHTDEEAEAEWDRGLGLQ